MAIKIYGNPLSSASRRVLVCLEEKEVDYEFVNVDLSVGQQKQDTFLTLSPFGQVPAIEDGELKLFESRAITQYLEHAYRNKGTPLLVEDPKKLAIVSAWMEVEALRFDAAASKINLELFVKKIKGMAADESVVAQFQGPLNMVLDVYEARLSETKYLGGDFFTLADLHHIPILNNFMGTKIKVMFDSRPHVSAWSADILSRPAWKNVVAKLKI